MNTCNVATLLMVPHEVKFWIKELAYVLVQNSYIYSYVAIVLQHIVGQFYCYLYCFLVMYAYLQTAL